MDIVKKLIGKNVESAREISRENGFFLVITKQDGELYVITDDILPNRVHVEIKDNIIIKAEVV